MSDNQHTVPYFIFLVICAVFFPIIEGGETVFGASVSNESVYQVDLTSNVEYKFLVLEKSYSGPEKIFVSISKDSYVPFEETFRLEHLDGVYFPYHPDFTVKENGTYNIHVKPLGSGSFRVGIREYS